MSDPSEAPPLPDYLVAFGPDANCTLDLCPIEWTVYHYRPMPGVNGMFIGFYALAMIVHVFLGIKWRQTWFMVFMILGCLCEIVGYVGRLIMYSNPFSFPGFMTQIVFITSGPVFYTAAIYVTLSKAVEYFSPELSRFRPKLFYWIFIPCDLFCLVLQAAGGALSTTTSGASQTGVDLALAGLSLQVVVVVVFCGFFTDYMVRYFRSGRAEVFGVKMKIFFGSLSAAILLILARCAYRCYELNEGYSGELIRDEGLFIALEGMLIVLAVFALCAGHPGLVFRKVKSEEGVSVIEKGGEGGESGEGGDAGVLTGRK